ncbi:MAG: 2-dehydropantoate 2-reductase [Magnetococcales bacterium]|nr:2-dehydropantoate 2-reductase [Magnetococcales bacterium]
MNPYHTPTEAKHPANVRSADPTVSILVVGAGAVGGYYGAALAKAGARVTTVHRSDYEHVRQHGIQIDALDHSEHFRPHQVINRITADHVPDYLVVALKALPDSHTSDLIRPAVGPNTVIVMLQNGLHVEETVQQAFPANEVITAMAFVCLQRSSPGHIRHSCHGRITLGRYPTGISPAVQQLGQLFEAGGVPCQLTDTPMTARWIKLVWNAAFNPVSVLAGHATTAAILAQPEGEALVKAIMEEVIAVARAHGHPLPDSLIDTHLTSTRSIPPYHTSMALDHMLGRPLETEVILGAAVRAAQQVGIATPLLTGLYGLMKILERRGE